MIESITNQKIEAKNTLLLGQSTLLNDLLVQDFLALPALKNQEVVNLDLELTDLDELLGNLMESSLFSGNKILIVKNPLFLTGKPNHYTKHQLTQLEQAMTQINELDNLVFFMAEYDKLDQRKKITKLIKQNFQIIDYTQKQPDLNKVTTAYLKQQQVQIAPQARSLIVRRSNNDLDQLLNNLDRLVAASTDGEINSELILQNIEQSTDESVFRILESALANNYDEAFLVLENELRKGTTPIALVGIFISQLTIVYQAKTLRQQFLEPQIVKFLKVHPYRVKLALQSKLALGQVRSLLQELIELDYQYKSGQAHDASALKIFILKI